MCWSFVYAYRTLVPTAFSKDKCFESSSAGSKVYKKEEEAQQFPILYFDPTNGPSEQAIESSDPLQIPKCRPSSFWCTFASDPASIFHPKPLRQVERLEKYLTSLIANRANNRPNLLFIFCYIFCSDERRKMRYIWDIKGTKLYKPTI